MKIVFALAMLASASAHQDEHKVVSPFGDDERDLQFCSCYAPKPEVDNCGFIYDSDSSEVTACVRRVVVDGNDDAEEFIGGIMDLSDDDIDLQSSLFPYSGIRFRDILIPQGAEIVSAKIVFTAEDDDSGTTNLVIQCEASDDAGAFTSTNFDISSRPMTGAQVNWNNVPAWTVGEKYETPDLRDIVQEIVNRGGWSSGNAVVFIISGTGDREAQTFEGSVEDSGSLSLAPELVLQFRTTGGTPDESIFERNGNTARLIGASGYPNKSWKLRGYPQGSQGDEAILPGIKYPLPYDGSSYPGKLNIKIKVAASRQWLDVNSRAKFQYRLYDCPGDCTPTAWTRVINFDNDGANQPPREGSATDRDDDDGFFERTLELFTDGCKNFDYEQIEFQIVNTNAANTGNNDKDFFVRQFYMNTVGCH